MREATVIIGKTTNHRPWPCRYSGGPISELALELLNHADVVEACGPAFRGNKLIFAGGPMSDVPALAPEPDMECAAACAAGWHGFDIGWERLQERAYAALRTGDRKRAARLFRSAWWLAISNLSRNDPRYATSLANAGMAAWLVGNYALARRHYARALRLWGAVPGWVEDMTIARRARSSLFHLRMEAKHWDTYQGNLRHRARYFAREAATCLDAATHGVPAFFRLYDRWRGERPALFDDMRKSLGAALLLAAWDPPTTTA